MHRLDIASADTTHTLKDGRGFDFRVGTAGWSIPRAMCVAFPTDGSHLQRYSSVFTAVEINSSFYRSHKQATYARWAATVPTGFRFSVKLSREVTHILRLQNCAAPLKQFFHEIEGLGDRLGNVLIQLPPSLAFERPTATKFFSLLRRHFSGKVVLEPRHVTWFGLEVDELLRKFHVGRTGSDPFVCDAAAIPMPMGNMAYRRLHGSPRMYYSNYDEAYLQILAATLMQNVGAQESWCIFDNTAHGFASANALRLLALLHSGAQNEPP
ncbi:MAG: DUF72 domain-containing protein [Rhodanobacteraceae bacterium]